MLFVLVEARAKEPIVPLDLWRRPHLLGVDGLDLLRGVRLLRRDRVPAALVPVRPGLHADRARASQALPLLVGLIVSSIASGLIVSRTGRYKCYLVGSIALMASGLSLMTQLTKDTPCPSLWLWMFITGLGVGPTFAVFTIVVQNSVPFRQLGVATVNLTFFRQIGGSVALAFVGTIFATTFQNDLSRS